MFKVIKARLKEPTEEWHKYMIGKELVLCSSFGGSWAVLAIESDEDLSEFCKYIWDNEDEHQYETLEGFMNDMDLANFWYGFEDDEIEIIEELSSLDIDKYLKKASEEMKL